MCVAKFRGSRKPANAMSSERNRSSKVRKVETISGLMDPARQTLEQGLAFFAVKGIEGQILLLVGIVPQVEKEPGLALQANKLPAIV